MTNLLNNDINLAQLEYYKYHNFIKALFIDTNPVPVKFILFKLNMIKTDNVRLPLIKIYDDKISDKLLEVINNLELHMEHLMLNV